MKPLQNTVVHLPTQEDYDEYMNMCEKAGWSVHLSNVWKGQYGSNTCVRVDKTACYADKEFYNDIGYKIITIKQLKDMNKTFKAGDKIRMIEDCLPEKKGYVYTLKEEGDGNLWAQGCSCEEKWELVIEEKTLETLEVGDLVKCDDGFRRILGVITPNNGELTLYIVSCWDINKNHADLKRVSHPITAFQLKADGYTPYTETSDEIEKAIKVLTDAGKIVNGKLVK